jgi:hypothetical protein
MTRGWEPGTQYNYDDVVAYNGVWLDVLHTQLPLNNANTKAQGTRSSSLIALR